METNKIYNENCLATLARMPDNFINCVVTSPPYWNLRDYGNDDQIGLEKTPEEYVNKMVEIFREVRRVLKKDGTLWLNLGDSYTSNGKAERVSSKSGLNHGRGVKDGQKSAYSYGRALTPNNLKPKDLIGIPWRVAFALQSDGWWLRQDIIWHKPNPMPESVTDRCTKAHEYIFLLTKSAKYFYDADAISENVKQIYQERAATFDRSGNQVAEHILPNQYYAQHRKRKERKYDGTNFGGNGSKIKNHKGNSLNLPNGKRNKRSVWKISTQPFPEAHFATFPEEIPSLCILAGCPKDGIVYDPFMGAATTALAALKYGRQFIGSELNPEYCEIGNKRIAPYLQQITLAI